MNSKPVLTLEQAMQVAAAAATEAKTNNWAVTIAIVDDGGHLLYLQRGHHTPFGSIDAAIMKARAAAAFQKPTKYSEDAVLSGRLIHLSLPGVIPSEGGVPLLHGETVIGAIGISGVRSFQDGQIAQAGAAALN